MSNDNQLEGILKKFKSDAINLEDAKKEILTLFTEPSEAPGGIYMLVITHMQDRPVTFQHCNVNPCDMFLLVKFGRTDSYAKRYAQFGFRYEKVFEVNGDNLMESWLKHYFPANFQKGFYQKKTKVPTIKQYLKFTKSQNPGPTEWRIMSKTLVDYIRKLSITSLNYKNLLSILTLDTLTVHESKLVLNVGEYSVSNKVSVLVQTLAEK